MEYKVIPITQLEHASWDQVKDGEYVVPIGFPNQTSKESKYIDIWQLQDTINISDIIEQATERKAGLMSAEDKEKLNNLDPNNLINSNITNGQKEGSLRTLGAVEENANYQLGKYAFAEGESTRAKGYAAHAEGTGSSAAGFNSHAEGNSIALGSKSHSENNGTSAVGDYSHAEGNQTTANGIGSHSEGGSTISTGENSHAEGQSSESKGRASHAEGYDTITYEDYCHTQNLGTIASSTAQTAIGKYNIEDFNDQYSLIIGNGIADNNRSNAAALTWQGDLHLAGNIYTNNSTSENNKLITSSQVINKVNKTDIGFTINGQSKDISNTSFLNLIYPIGSIYMSMNNTNPENLFGGTWQSLAPGKMLLGADGSDYITGHVTKGQGGRKDAVLVEHSHDITRTQNVSIANHTVGVTQPTFSSPNHYHTFKTKKDYASGGKLKGIYSSSDSTWSGSTVMNATGGGACTRTTSVGVSVSAHSVSTQPEFSSSTEGTSPINANMPPYLVVNMWQRIS